MNTNRKNLSIKSWVLFVGVLFCVVIQAQGNDTDLTSDGTIFTASSTQRKLAATDPAQKIIVTSNNSQFIIILKANPTTGYSWNLVQYESNLLELKKKLYNPQKKSRRLTRAPGYEIWTFRVKPEVSTLNQSSILTNITLAYVQPWLETRNPQLWQKQINNNKITFTVEIIYADKTT